MSYVVLVQCVGFVLGPLMGGLLSSPKEVAIFGLSLPFYGAAVLALLAFLSIAFFFKESFTSPTKKFHLLRIFYVFKEAAIHPRMRLLTSAFIFSSGWNWAFLFSSFLSIFKEHTLTQPLKWVYLIVISACYLRLEFSFFPRFCKNIPR